MTESKGHNSLLVSLVIDKQDNISAESFDELRREISMLMASVGARVIKDPMSNQSSTWIEAIFEVSEQMLNVVNDVLNSGLKVQKMHNGSVVINKLSVKPGSSQFVYSD